MSIPRFFTTKNWIVYNWRKIHLTDYSIFFCFGCLLLFLLLILPVLPILIRICRRPLPSVFFPPSLLFSPLSRSFSSFLVSSVRIHVPFIIVADPGCLSRIQGQKYSRIRIRIKKFKYLNPKIVSKFSEIWFKIFILDPDPRSGSWFYISRIPGPERHRGDPGSGSGSWI